MDFFGKKLKIGLLIIVLFSFVSAFLAARIFTRENPDIVLIARGEHIHHFWYGLVLLSFGGWMYISQKGLNVQRLAVTFFGGGLGLITEEFRLLLQFELQAIILLASAYSLIAVYKIVKIQSSKLYRNVEKFRINPLNIVEIEKE